MTYKVFANGNTLPASDLQTNLMQQVIAVFADATARDAAITAPVNGQYAHLTGTNSLTRYNGSSWTPAVPGTASAVTEQATSRTIAAGDANSFIYATAAITITIDDEIATGETINFIQNAAGAITFAAGAGVSLSSKDDLLDTGGQFSGASITKKDTNSYYLVGDLA